MSKIQIRPSKMDLTMICPGSVRMQAPYKFEDSDAATRGRNLHDAMALLFQVGTAAWPKIKANANLDEKDVAVLPEVFKLGLSQKPDDPDCLVMVEQPLDCGFMGVESGKPDLIFLSELHKVAVIVDWKFGKRPVEQVGENKQLLSYACGIMAKHPDLSAVEVVIIQPFGDEPADWASSHTWTKEDLRSAAKMLKDAANAAREPGAHCEAGGHCVNMFCSARKDGETKEGAPITACRAYLDYKQRIAEGKAEEKAKATQELIMPGTPGTEITISPDVPITGPFYIATADTIALAKQKREFALSLRVTDAQTADVAGRTRQELAKLSKLVKDNRETLNGPILALQRAMMARQKEVTDPLDEAAEHLAKQVTAYATAEEAKRKAALAEEDRKRREAEAAERQAQAEAERRQAEALKAAQEAQEALARAALLKTKAARDKAEAEAREAQKRAQEAQRQQAEEEEKRLQAVRAQERADAEAQALLQPAAKIAGYRTEDVQDYTIPDFSKIPPAMLEIVLLPNDKVIKQMIKTGALSEAKLGTWLTIARSTKAVGSR